MHSKKSLNEGLRQAAAAHAKKRSTEIVSAIEAAINMIDTEMTENHGIYPHNGGKLNQRELCRRAGVSFMTLQSPAHKETTRRKVEKWLASKSTVTKKASAKAVTDRVGYWKEQHLLVATQIYIYELEKKEKDLANEKLREENKALRTQLAKANNARVANISQKSPEEL